MGIRIKETDRFDKNLCNDDIAATPVRESRIPKMSGDNPKKNTHRTVLIFYYIIMSYK